MLVSLYKPARGVGFDDVRLGSSVILGLGERVLTKPAQELGLDGDGPGSSVVCMGFQPG